MFNGSVLKASGVFTSIVSPCLRDLDARELAAPIPPALLTLKDDSAQTVSPPPLPASSRVAWAAFWFHGASGSFAMLRSWRSTACVAWQEEHLNSVPSGTGLRGAYEMKGKGLASSRARPAPANQESPATY